MAFAAKVSSTLLGLVSGELNMYSKFYSTHCVLLNICLLRQAQYVVKFKVVNILLKMGKQKLLLLGLLAKHS